MIQYFAYGSNLNVHALKKRGVVVIKIARGVLHNWKLVFNLINDDIEGAGYASIMEMYGASVEGAIIITDELSITHLDVYEDYPVDYHKRIVRVENEMGDEIECMVYVANKERCRSDLKPTTQYLNEILQGERFFSKKYFEELKRTSAV